METKQDYQIAAEELNELWAEHVKSNGLTVDITGPIPKCEDDWPCMFYLATIGSTVFEYSMGVGHAKMERFKGKENTTAMWKFQMPDEWIYALEHINNGRQLKDKKLVAQVACRVGRDIRPNVADVVASACRDYMSANQAGDFESWCGEFGYDTDSRKAESIYRACIEISGKLRRIGLTHSQAEKFAELSSRL